MLQEEIEKEQIMNTNMLEKQNKMEVDKNQSLQTNSNMLAQIKAANQKNVEGNSRLD